MNKQQHQPFAINFNPAFRDWLDQHAEEIDRLWVTMQAGNWLTLTTAMRAAFIAGACSERCKPSGDQK